MARRNRRPNTAAQPARTTPGPASPDLAAVDAARATEAARRAAGADLRSRTRVRNAPPGFRPPPAPWYAMMSMAGPAYRELAFASNSAAAVPRDNWGNYFERCLRYDVFWSHYEGNVYRHMHRWAEALKESHGLYEFVRTIFSPAGRVGEFWASHILGGPLDPDAGDGQVVPTALPIVAKNQALRPAIAQVWRDSNFQATKDTLPRMGGVMGDVGLMVVDDEARQKVYLKPIHPRTVMDVTRDPWGNVKGYVLSEPRLDPRNPDPFIKAWVTYTEVACRVGDAVEYTTYLDNVPFDWRDYDEDTAEADRVGPVWAEDYGFIPLLFHQHRDMGLGFGWSELQNNISKLYELDDVASKVSDQIRKVVDAGYFVAGAAAGDLVATDDDEDGQDARERIAMLFGPTGSTLTPMVVPLDIAAALSYLKAISAEIEADHPELASENVSADASGEARRVARQRAEALVLHRRAGYDDLLVRAQQMAISIGAQKGYPGYEAFDADSYANGDLAHAIGPRPVFAVTDDDRRAAALALAQTLQALSAAGLPMRSMLRLAGVAPEVTREIVADAEAEAAGQARLDAARSGFLDGPDGPADGEDAGDGSNAGDGGIEASSAEAVE